MPIYEYQCQSCGQFEVMQRITDRPLTRCPTCHRKVTKLISNTSFQLKGTGWYVTDYARKDTKTKDKKSEPTSEKAGDTKTATSGTEPSPSKSTKSKGAAAA